MATLRAGQVKIYNVKTHMLHTVAHCVLYNDQYPAHQQTWDNPLTRHLKDRFPTEKWKCVYFRNQHSLPKVRLSTEKRKSCK